MKRRMWVLVCCVAVVLLIAAIICWRQVPRSADRILPDWDEATVRAAFTSVEHGTVNGETYSNSYNTGTVSPTDPAYQKVLEILHSTTYKPSLKNLLGWSDGASNGPVSGTYRYFAALYVWGKEADSVTIAVYDDDNQVILKVNDRIYYSEDLEILGKMVQLTKEYDILK